MSWERIALIVDAVAGVFLWLMAMMAVGQLPVIPWSALALGGLLIMASLVYAGNEWLQQHDL